MEYLERRSTLFQQMAPCSLAIVASSCVQTRSYDSILPFRQNSDFYYLTGFNEPESLLVLLKSAHGLETILFHLPKDPKAELWEGPRLGQQAAICDLKVDQAYDIQQFAEKLPELLLDIETLYYSFGEDKTRDSLLLDTLQKSRKSAKNPYPRKIADLVRLIREMRLIKSQQEVKLLETVCEISAKAHASVMAYTNPGMFEYELAAKFAYEITKGGCQSLAYPSIVGSGNNANILHYIINQDQIQLNDLVLMDAGAERDCYAADITRTFPATGKFTVAQKALYEVVLEAQLAGIESVQVGVAWDEIQKTIVSKLTLGLRALKIEGPLAQYYVHSSGHWLGLDVHDPSAYKQDGNWRCFQPNMVLTIEPGLYFKANDTTVDPKWRGIGIRIEDDILVTEKGAKVLSLAAPKSVLAIEQLMANR